MNGVYVFGPLEFFSDGKTEAAVSIEISQVLASHGIAYQAYTRYIPVHLDETDGVAFPCITVLMNLVPTIRPYDLVY